MTMKKKKVFITGIGLNCGLGSLMQSWQRILAKETAIKLSQPFANIPAYPLALIGSQPSFLENILQTALKDALINAKLTLPLINCGVVVGSSRSYQNLWEIFLTEGLQTPWLDSLPYQPSRLVAQYLGTQGTVFSPMAACATGIWAFAQAYELIQQEICEIAIAGAVETPVTPLTLAGFQKMGALGKTGCYPFDSQREGLVLGEGAAIFVLESEKSLHKRGILPYGELLGVGFTCDSYHLTAPCQDNTTAANAIRQCLRRSGLTPEMLPFIHSHGTSTRLNDQREAQLIASIFPSDVAVSSTKGATGHTLGASGALGAAFSLLALKYQQLPPCVGLKNPAFDLNFVQETKSCSLQSALCLSFGFGGQNAAIAFGDAASLQRD
ncbi:MAG: beta-ketoacyl-ACP synthase [Microcystaceae cyanobacterium]